MERRSRGLGLVTVTLCAVLSGCAARINSDLHAQMTAAARDHTIDNGAVVSTSDLRIATEAQEPAGYGFCLVEVTVTESPLRRDALQIAPIVGYIAPGEKLTSLDFIDRRLRVLGRIVFDGGNWRKVRGQRGAAGWLPAIHIREVREPCEAEGIAMSGERRAPEQARR